MPDITCPGCGKHLTNFMQAVAHYADAEDMRAKKGDGSAAPWPYSDAPNGPTHGTVCEWDRDYLAAEWFRQNPNAMKV